MPEAGQSQRTVNGCRSTESRRTLRNVFPAPKRRDSFPAAHSGQRGLAVAALAAAFWIGMPRIHEAAAPDPPAGTSALRDIVASGHLSDLRWPDFSDYVVW